MDLILLCNSLSNQPAAKAHSLRRPNHYNSRAKCPIRQSRHGPPSPARLFQGHKSKNASCPQLRPSPLRRRGTSALPPTGEGLLDMLSDCHSHADVEEVRLQPKAVSLAHHVLLAKKHRKTILIDISTMNIEQGLVLGNIKQRGELYISSLDIEVESVKRP